MGLFLKQAFVRVNGLGGVAGQSLKIGRQEFNDGLEVTPKNGTLAALGRDRISQRVLGNFGFTDVLRSLDGVQYVLNTRKLNVTALAARPTEGVFQVNGWAELNINVFYAALTGQSGSERNPGEWRVFGLGYDDYRHGVLKTDNRSAAARTADKESIAIGTYGGDFLQVAATPAGPVDLLFWGVVQTGSWGTLSHRAGAYAAEAGWQPSGLPALKPWIRAGYDYSTGDSNPTDDRHGTYFQTLPTARIYARMPFFNLMNNADAFAEVILRPSSSLHVAQRRPRPEPGGPARSLVLGRRRVSGGHLRLRRPAVERPDRPRDAVRCQRRHHDQRACRARPVLRVCAQPGRGARHLPDEQRRPPRLRRVADSFLKDLDRPGYRSRGAMFLLAENRLSGSHAVLTSTRRA